jgi:Tfp pilus assembly protein PilO
MVLSKRERQIFIVTLSVLVIFLCDRFILEPVLDARTQMMSERQELKQKIQKASEMIKQKKKAGPEWDNRVNNGLSSDVSVAESTMLNALRNWTQSYGLTLVSIKPERKKGEEGEMKEIIFNLVCSGSMSSVGQFLFQVESTFFPVKIKDFQLGSRAEDGNEMSLQLKLSSIYLGETVEKTPSVKKNSKGEE